MIQKLNNNLFKVFLEETLAPFDSATCLTGEGEILDIKYETLADIGSLGVSATTVIKYFQLKMGDVVLLNDPYSGGTVLSTMTLVTPLVLNHAQVPNLYLAVRTGFRPKLVISESLEEEGLRIPPTPLVQNRELNRMILEAMSAHPSCPEGLTQRLENVLRLIWKRVDSFQTLLLKSSAICSRPTIKTYLKDSRSYLQRLLAELPNGEHKVETRLESGETLKLRLEISQEQVLFDFAGTSVSKRLCLTDAATFGACFGALSALIQKQIPLNSGSFSLLQVTSPLGSFLNARYPSPTFKGMTEGTSMVAGLTLQAFSEIVPSRKVSMSAQVPTQISFEFEDGRKFFDSLPGGIGASSNQEGSDAVHFWVRNRLQSSVQEIENRFPLIIHTVGIRKGSGGKGQFSGGNGMTKKYEVTTAGKLHWIMQQKKSPPKGAKGAQDGQPPEIHIHRKTGKLETLEKAEGEIQVSKGDLIVVCSAGGGGWGKA